MKYYSFEKLSIGEDGFYNLFKKTTVNPITNSLKQIIVTDEYAGKLHLICKYLHGNTNFIEELMTINNIINPFSVDTGTVINYYENTNEYEQLYKSDNTDTSLKDEILSMNKNKSTTSDSNRIGSPPTIKPDSLTQVDINTTNRTVTIINKFK